MPGIPEEYFIASEATKQNRISASVDFFVEQPLRENRWVGIWLIKHR
jgi:hypothetical protein